jgi:hypothetical protein
LDSFYYHTFDFRKTGDESKGIHIWEISADGGPFRVNHVPCESALVNSSRLIWSDNTYILSLPLVRSVTFVLRNLTPHPHPMHMHGHHFEVLEINIGTDNIHEVGTTEKKKECKKLLPLDTAFSESMDNLMERKKQGVMKDTVVLPSCGAVALRMNSDNRGVWFFHCHIKYHVHHGLAVVLDEGGALFSHPMSDFPSDYPSCNYCKN